jgi:adenylate cyclase
MAWLARAPFLVHLVVKTGVYLVVILFALALGARLFPAPSEVGIAVPIEPWDVVFSLVAIVAFRFVADVNQLLGQNALLNFLTGRYYRPRLEERVFLLIDIEGSTALAERLGERGFHRLLNRFVADITGPIVAAYGEIYRYVGDELIASWRLSDGVADGRCVRACFAAFECLAALAPVYRRDFGAAVHCRAALHCGPVVAGEMGTVKREIVFLGDTLNTAARIQDFCRQTGHRVLASAGLLDLVELPPGIVGRSLGALRLRGKESEIGLYALEAETAAPIVRDKITV